jgi:hypothetical protein
MSEKAASDHAGEIERNDRSRRQRFYPLAAAYGGGDVRRDEFTIASERVRGRTLGLSGRKAPASSDDRLSARYRDSGAGNVAR